MRSQIAHAEMHKTSNPFDGIVQLQKNASQVWIFHHTKLKFLTEAVLFSCWVALHKWAFFFLLNVSQEVAKCPFKICFCCAFRAAAEYCDGVCCKVHRYKAQAALLRCVCSPVLSLWLIILSLSAASAQSQIFLFRQRVHPRTLLISQSAPFLMFVSPHLLYTHAVAMHNRTLIKSR